MRALARIIHERDNGASIGYVDGQGGRLTSDGSWCWVAVADADRELSETQALAVPAQRHRSRHSRPVVLRQRLFQIAANYADQNDADALRHDHLLTLVCGRLTESDPDLAS